MAMLIEKTKIPRELDRRVKITLEQRKEIKSLYKTGNYSQRKLASMFNVSRRLITFYIDDDKQKRNLEIRKNSYYNKEKNNNYTKTHREYKKNLYSQGLLIEK